VHSFEVRPVLLAAFVMLLLYEINHTNMAFQQYEWDAGRCHTAHINMVLLNMPCKLPRPHGQDADGSGAGQNSVADSNNVHSFEVRLL
jgi:hypothetical protein